MRPKIATPQKQRRRGLGVQTKVGWLLSKTQKGKQFCSDWVKGCTVNEAREGKRGLGGGRHSRDRGEEKPKSKTKNPSKLEPRSGAQLGQSQIFKGRP